MPSQNYIFGDAIDLSRAENTFHTANHLSISSRATVYFQFNTGNKDCLVIEYGLTAATQSLRFKALESPTVTNGTTAITPVHVNRNYSAAATMTLFSDPTSISGGTVLVDDVIPSGGNKTGGGLVSAVYWTMKKNTKYVASLENLGNSTTVASFQMAWNEL